MKVPFPFYIFLLLSSLAMAQEASLEKNAEKITDTIVSEGPKAELLAEPNVSDEEVSDYIADSMGIAADDTSYFYRGDPEYNLIRATEFSQLNIVKMLVERGVDVDVETLEGVTPLMFAAQNGDKEMMKYLIGKGADVNARPDNLVTPLIGAARTGQYEAVSLLLEAGADANAKDELDLTSLMHASAYNYPDVVEILIDNGAKTETSDWFGTRSLMMAAYYNCLEAADVLIEKGAQVDAKDNNGFTALMIAAQHGDYDMAWMLLDAGADPGIRNEGGLHALALAVMKGDEDMVELLTESGADINQDINSSTNSLNLAKERGNTEMMRYLLENGAKQNNFPEISEIRGGFLMNLNGTDFMLGFEAGVSENKYNSYLTTGMIVRPAAVRVLREENDTLAYQFWEKRYIWPLTLGKNFGFDTPGGNRIGIRLHLSGALTWGSYRGSGEGPKTRLLLLPGTGIYWRERYFGLSMDYQYVPVKAFGISNHRIQLSILGFWDFRNRMRHTRKDISWW